MSINILIFIPPLVGSLKTLRADGILYSTQTKDDLSMTWYIYIQSFGVGIGGAEGSVVISVVISEGVPMQAGWGGGVQDRSCREK